MCIFFVNKREVCRFRIYERHICHVSILSFRKVIKIWNEECEMSDNKSESANPEKESFLSLTGKLLCFEKIKFYQQKVLNIF